MHLEHVIVGSTTVPFFTKGSAPKWLIFSGTHGDEYEVITVIEQYLTAHEQELPDFLWVLEVSPSAVAAKRRHNAHGLDMNRAFFDDTIDEEVRAVQQIMQRGPFEMFIDIHEDPSTTAFYFYDSEDARATSSLQLLYRKIQDMGVSLFNGTDDPDDAALGYVMKDGYCALPLSEDEAYQSRRDTGTTWSYLANRGLVTKRLVNPEVPGRIPYETKQNIVGAILSYLNQE